MRKLREPRRCQDHTAASNNGAGTPTHVLSFQIPCLSMFFDCPDIGDRLIRQVALSPTTCSQQSILEWVKRMKNALLAITWKLSLRLHRDIKSCNSSFLNCYANLFHRTMALPGVAHREVLRSHFLFFQDPQCAKDHDSPRKGYNIKCFPSVFHHITHFIELLDWLAYYRCSWEANILVNPFNFLNSGKLVLGIISHLKPTV